VQVVAAVACAVLAGVGVTQLARARDVAEARPALSGVPSVS
jgi:hypothetical protein